MAYNFAMERFTEQDYQSVYDFMLPLWKETYGGILPAKQIEFLVDKYFSAEGLTHYRALGYEYFKLGQDGVLVVCERETDVYIDKLYLLPSSRGKDIPEKVFAELAKRGKNLTLNVNQGNERAVHCYRKNGFEVIETVDILLDNGMVNKDFVMRKRV